MKLSLARWKEGRTSSADAVPKKPAGVIKCWTWIWLSCWIQAWIWMEDLLDENNMKQKTSTIFLPVPNSCLTLISFHADEQSSLYFCLLFCCLLCPLCLRTLHFLFWCRNTYFMHLKIHLFEKPHGKLTKSRMKKETTMPLISYLKHRN